MFGLTTKSRTTWGHEALYEASDYVDGFTQAETVQAEGIVSGTKIHSEHGWRPIEAIQPGDKITTFDNGPRAVAQVKRAQLWTGQGNCPRHALPLAVPAGALGNATPLLLLPEQNVMIESDLAESVFGDPFAMIPSAALEGYNGITRIEPMGTTEVFVLEFEEEQVIYANGAGMIHCQAAAHDRRGIEVFLEDNTQGYASLPIETARALVAALDSCEG
ncbi:hypothetical protein BFP70_00870 [Thioclava sp. SK-1]|nr:hypothetical protein BFP70_00870 [Thioclava sp. SK-1]